jgi:L-ascorbate metabolism protein UlaG (beta-lactamase superfamily)
VAQPAAPPTRPLTADAFAPSERTLVTWLTGGGFLVNARGTLLMIDPVIALDPTRPGVEETGHRLLVDLPIEAHDVPRLDAVLYTHADADHLAPRTATALARLAPTYLGPPPCVARLAALGIAADPVEIGRPRTIGPATVTPTRADHPWQLLDPARFGAPWGPDDCCGYRIETPDGVLWCPGDTRLLDEHLTQPHVDLLLLDVSPDTYHLGVESAARLAAAYPAATLLAYHYGSYDAPTSTAFNGDPAAVAARLADPTRLRTPAAGEPVSVAASGA